MAAKIMGILAAGLILWVVLSAPSSRFSEDESVNFNQKFNPRSELRHDCISNPSPSGNQVCSPSSVPEKKG